MACRASWPLRTFAPSSLGSWRPARGGGIIWGFGAHVVKTGLVADSRRSGGRGFVSAVATNGAGSSTTSRSRSAGSTSEDVDAALGPGRFGMAEETGRKLNAAIVTGVGRGWASASPSRYLRSAQPPYAQVSIACHGRALGIPLTVHVALGHRHHPHAPGCVRRGHRRGQPARLPLLHVERREARQGASTSTADRRLSCPRSSSRPSRSRATAASR